MRSLVIAVAMVSATNGEAPGEKGTSTIVPLLATFGTPGRRPLDVRDRIASLCGPTAQSCQVFCSQTTFGGRHQDKHALCRVTYRCGAASVRVAEAVRDEPLSLKCDAPKPVPTVVAVDEPVPPPMSAN